MSYVMSKLFAFSPCHQRENHLATVLPHHCKLYFYPQEDTIEYDQKQDLRMNYKHYFSRYKTRHSKSSTNLCPICQIAVFWHTSMFKFSVYICLKFYFPLENLFFSWEHGEESLKVFVKQVNMFHSTVKFTSEYS